MSYYLALFGLRGLAKINNSVVTVEDIVQYYRECGCTVTKQMDFLYLKKGICEAHQIGDGLEYSHRNKLKINWDFNNMYKHTGCDSVEKHQIEYIEAENHEICLYPIEDNFKLYNMYYKKSNCVLNKIILSSNISLQKILNKELSNDPFFQISRRIAINVNYLVGQSAVGINNSATSYHRITLSSGKEFEISRRRQRPFLAFLKMLNQGRRDYANMRNEANGKSNNLLDLMDDDSE